MSARHWHTVAGRPVAFTCKQDDVDSIVDFARHPGYNPFELFNILGEEFSNSDEGALSMLFFTTFRE